MPISYPDAWSSLAHPQVRHELILTLDELSNEQETARWLDPNPAGPIIGIDQVFHFFFDDHDFAEAGAEVGHSLFDAAESDAVMAVTRKLDAIHLTNPDGDSRYYLRHANWPEVVEAANRVALLIKKRGLPVFS